jgi:hypothetical protein
MTPADPQPERGSLSLWLHAAVLARLFQDPDVVIERARVNLAAMQASGAGARSEPYLREWDAFLDAGVAAIADTLLGPSDHGVTMRSRTPFAGALPQDEVAAIMTLWQERE